ncbi:hypothetical protein ASG29_00200 [Sphingomonas sp. Leaf412]|uniref:phosphoenolpyruvate--protein phosphotransferase n=1 Tax=Sphingomonas sp. Leaf412 TaxID=1736370 RepID=UPI0006FD7FED|nr:phosphoenolpyruvate--protein phosphotransferase [Sphingomonas sp. Leaf412]KQT34637.1 hypothetical protein ASG29_00200 [Sphingomonas sp. Leaf412]
MTAARESAERGIAPVGTGSITLVAPLDGWAGPVSAVPDPVFAGGMMGPGIAIDPTGDTLHAPCDATVVGMHEAGHAVTLRTGQGADLLLHIGIDSVALAGEGFRPLVDSGAAVVAGQPLIAFDLDLIVRRAAAATTPVLLIAGAFDVVPDVTGGRVTVGDPLLRLVATAPVDAAGPVAAATMIRRTLVVALPHGLHARPAARIAAAARGRDAQVMLSCGPHRAAAASMTGLLTLGAGHGATVAIEGGGREAAGVVAAIAAILTADDEPGVAPTAPVAARRDMRRHAPGTIAGVAAAPGSAIGPACRLHAAAPIVPADAGDVAAERAAFDTGLARLRHRLDGATGVLGAHRAMLDDPALLDAIGAAIDAGRGAAAAALAITQAQAQALAAADDARIAERGADLIDIGQRLAHAILGTAPDAIEVPAGGILLADDILPSQLAAIPPGRLAGIALAAGGPTAHVAIMAAGAGVPMAVALGRGIDAIPDGRIVMLDGDDGVLDPAPDDAALATAHARIAHAAAAEAAARADAGLTATTRDGRMVTVQANLGTAPEAAAAVAAGAEGCGLLRTELLFLDRAAPPSRDEQADAYRAIAAALAGRPLTIRLLDVGGDKPAPYLSLPHEDNPALGRRGIRILLNDPSLLETQLAAIVDATDTGPCRIMVPMVTGADEMAAVRAALDRVRGARTVALGAMIETPAAAIAADLIAAECDFLSIGSNDLTQYALAMDRGNPAVAAGVDGLHPAVLRLIAATCDGAARRDVPVGVCGGLAADAAAVPILIGLGVTSLSVPPGRVAAIRAVVARIDAGDAAAHARAALSDPSPRAVRDRARAYAEGDGA